MIRLCEILCSQSIPAVRRHPSPVDAYIVMHAGSDQMGVTVYRLARQVRSVRLMQTRRLHHYYAANGGCTSIKPHCSTYYNLQRKSVCSPISIQKDCNRAAVYYDASAKLWRTRLILKKRCNHQSLHGVKIVQPHDIFGKSRYVFAPLAIAEIY